MLHVEGRRTCRLPRWLLTFLAPRRIFLPVAGHDAPVGDHLVDHFGQAVMFDLRPHVRSTLVGTGQITMLINA